MPITAEDRTRESIDRLLSYVSWVIQSHDEANNLLEPDSRSPQFFSRRVLETLNG